MQRSKEVTMFVAIVRHQIQPGKMQEAAARINSNGTRMRERPGFVSRRLLAPADGADELATVTLWTDQAAYDAWVAHNRTANVHAGSESPYVGSPDTRLYVEYGS
jgi:heme-degrading monooxygenase HmoA